MSSEHIDGGKTVAGYSHSHDRYVNRLRRIEGQIRGIQRMVDEEQYCIDVLTQIAAVKSALDSVALGLVEDHMSHCVVEAAQRSAEEADQKVAEAVQAIARLIKS